MPESIQGQLDRLHARIRACRQCQEQGYLPQAKPVFSGRLTDQVMVMGQAPGRRSVETGRLFGGPSGQKLDEWLTIAGFQKGSLWSKVYLTSLTKCDPGPSLRGSGDRKPSPQELALCRPFLEAELRIVHPKVVLLVGGMAFAAFMGPRPLEQAVGTWQEREGMFFLALPHSSGVSRWLNDPAHQAMLRRALEKLAEWRRTHSL